MADHGVIFHVESHGRCFHHADPYDAGHRANDGKPRECHEQFTQGMCHVNRTANTHALFHVESLILRIIIKHAADPEIVIVLNDRYFFLIARFNLFIPKHKQENASKQQHHVSDECDHEQEIRIRKQKPYHPADHESIIYPAGQYKHIRKVLLFCAVIIGIYGTVPRNDFILESVKEVYLSGGEGCLSVDDKHDGYVYRHNKIQVKAFNAQTQKEEIITARGYEAIVLQHEIDHLNGILYYDHIDKKNPFLTKEDAIRL